MTFHSYVFPFYSPPYDFHIYGCYDVPVPLKNDFFAAHVKSVWQPRGRTIIAGKKVNTRVIRDKKSIIYYF